MLLHSSCCAEFVAASMEPRERNGAVLRSSLSGLISPREACSPRDSLGGTADMSGRFLRRMLGSVELEEMEIEAKRRKVKEMLLRNRLHMEKSSVKTVVAAVTAGPSPSQPSFAVRKLSERRLQPNIWLHDPAFTETAAAPKPVARNCRRRALSSGGRAASPQHFSKASSPARRQSTTAEKTPEVAAHQELENAGPTMSLPLPMERARGRRFDALETMGVAEEAASAALRCVNLVLDIPEAHDPVLASREPRALRELQTNALNISLGTKAPHTVHKHEAITKLAEAVAKLRQAVGEPETKGPGLVLEEEASPLATPPLAQPLPVEQLLLAELFVPVERLPHPVTTRVLTEKQASPAPQPQPGRTKTVSGSLLVAAAAAQAARPRRPSSAERPSGADSKAKTAATPGTFGRAPARPGSVGADARSMPSGPLMAKVPHMQRALSAEPRAVTQAASPAAAAKQSKRPPARLMTPRGKADLSAAPKDASLQVLSYPNLPS